MPTTKTQPTAAGVLALEAIGDELGCSPLLVKRLIFRGRLQATILKARDGTGRDRINNSQIKALATSVAKYVADGAEDFTAPAISDSPGGWFADPEGNFVELARGVLQEACESQLLSDAEVTRRYDAAMAGNNRTGYVDGLARNIAVTLKASSDVMNASSTARKQIVRGSAYSKDLIAILGRCKTWLRLIAISGLRRHARAAVSEVQQKMDRRAGEITATDVLSLSPLDGLYSGDYQLICAAALAKLRETNVLAFRKTTYLKPDFDATSGAVARVREGSVSVQYTLPFSAVAFDEELLYRLAF